MIKRYRYLAHRDRELLVREFLEAEGAVEFLEVLCCEEVIIM